MGKASFKINGNIFQNKVAFYSSKINVIEKEGSYYSSSAANCLNEEASVITVKKST